VNAQGNDGARGPQDLHADLVRFSMLAGATAGEIEVGFAACEAAGLRPGWYAAARVAGSRHGNFIELLEGCGPMMEEVVGAYVERLTMNADPDRAGHQKWVSRVNHRWATSAERGHELIDTQILAAPPLGSSSNVAADQLIWGHLSNPVGTHWFVVELDLATGTAGTWEWPVGSDAVPGWREVSLQDLGMKSGEMLVSRYEAWPVQSAASAGVDCYSIEMDRLDQLAAKIAHAAGRGTPAEIDPEFAGRVAHATAVASSPRTGVWDRRGDFILAARQAAAQGEATLERLRGRCRTLRR
jgi:hypothetical protein